MEKVEVSKDGLIQMYQKSSKDVKTQMEKLYGKAVFEPKITDQLVTFEDVLKYNGESLEAFEKRCEHDTVFQKAVKQIEAIVLAFNGGVHATYDGKTWRYYPWFNVIRDSSAPSGFGFSCVDWTAAGSYAGVGSRICFIESAHAEYAGKTFIDIYTNYLQG